MQGVDTDIIIEQIEMVIEKAIAENDAVLQSLILKNEVEERTNATGGTQNETSSREELQVIY